MLQSIKFELKRMILSISFRFGIVLSCIFSVANFIQNVYYKLNNINDFSVFEKWLGTSNETFGGLAFYWLFPIIASIPYGWTLCDEIHNGYAMQILSRSSNKRYFISKMIVSFLSGGIVIALPLVLDFFLITALDRAYYPQPNDLTSSIWAGSFCSTLYYKNPILFVFTWTSIEFLWGGAIAALCCALGMYIKKKLILIPTMLLIFICESVLFLFIHIKRNNRIVETSWLNVTHANTLNINSGWFIFGSIFLILIISIILLAIKGVKYESL